MDKQQARDLIKDTFEQPFDKTRFTAFIKNLLNRIGEAPFTYQGQFIPDAYKPYISVLERIGKYSDGEHKIDILVIKLKKETSLERARTMQRNFVAWYLNGSRGGELKDAALVAFIAPDDVDWRFSLVKMDYKFEPACVTDAAGRQTPSGKMKVKEEFTPARRWSFLVGVNERSHTAQSRLVNILANDEMAPTLAELEEAFNIETVTKEFFLKYRDLFIRTKEALDKVVKNDDRIKADFEAKGVNTVDFAKKLLGQIVFLYFLQKKGWFGVARDATWGSGTKQFLRELFEKKHGSFNNFFNDILEPLFYEALRIGEERKQDDYYYSRFNCKIPFLNGGLFDPIGNYDWVNTDIILPDMLFSNTNKTKEGDIGDGMLDIFDRYNFTVKEDEPLEKEVAIDPELLGKAYEKFNAIRPDNFEEYKKALKSGKKGDESKFNKQFGVYYTPREIVHYMCRESLINYLYTELNHGIVGYEKLGDRNLDMFGNEGKKGQLDLTVDHTENPQFSEKDIEALIRMGEQVGENDARVASEGRETKTYSYQLPENIRNNAVLIDQKLADITVCDPAVGSGAFPVGMMSEIVKARNVLSTFIEDDNRTPYVFKRRCIEHSLYGVDIDPGAVEIAKLRLWLSLVVDEEDIKNIKPLPNLDYKIVCGNSLHSFPFQTSGLQEIEALKLQYFEETAPAKKQFLKRLIDEKLQQRFSASEKGIGYRITFDARLLFSEVFHVKRGFDVVIANPPYVRQEAIKEFKPQLKQTFGAFYCGTADLYTYFYKRGLEILKPAGHLCFIAPNKFMRAGYGKNTRMLLANEATPKIVIDFGDLPIFDATTYPSILLMERRQPSITPVIPSSISCHSRGCDRESGVNQKTISPIEAFGDDNPIEAAGMIDSVFVATFTDVAQLERLNETLAAVGFSMPITALKAEGWTLERPDVLALMEKLSKAGKPLGEYVQGKFYYGIKTGLNEAFVIDEAIRRQLIAEDPKSAELIKPWLRGRDIRKWRAQWAGLYLITIASSANREWPWSKEKTEAKARPLFAKAYPAIHRHLSQYEDKLRKRDDKGKFWWELRSCVYYNDFASDKIVYPDIAHHSKFTWDESKAFLGNTAYMIPTNEKWLVGLLNSSLIWWFYLNISSMIQGGFVRFIAQYMEQVPIPSATATQKAPIIERVQKILANPDSPAVPHLETEIDKLVYELYGLTEAEIALVEGN